MHSYDHENLDTIADVSKTLPSQVEEFFVSYKKQRREKFRITGTGGPKKALKALKALQTAMEAKKRENEK